jgi:hypothetical protein
MNYITLLPSDLQKLLPHYTNYYYWEVIYKLYDKYCTYVDKDISKLKLSKMCSKLDLFCFKYQMLQYSCHSQYQDSVRFTALLNTEELITYSILVKFIKQLINTISDTELFNISRYTFSAINKYLRDNNCSIAIAFIKTYDHSTKYMLVNPDKCGIRL